MLARLLALLCVLPLRGGERAFDGSVPAACLDACVEGDPLRAVESLALGGEASVPALVGMLSDARPPVRCAAARRATRLGGQEHALEDAAEVLK